MAFQKGDVVLVPFPAADMSSTKTRPAVVVSTDLFATGEGRLLVAGVTSNLAAHQNATSYELPDWAAVGLKKPSIVTSWIACGTQNIVAHKVGALRATEVTEVETCLRRALGL